MKTKLIRNLKLTMLILATFEIIGCNNVGSLETKKTSNTSNSKALNNGTTLYDVNLLGDKANFFSEGNKDNLPELNSFSCLNPNAFAYSLGKFENTEKIDIKYGDSSSFSSLLADASISGGYSIFSAKAEAGYATTSTDNEKSLDVTIFYEKKGFLSMNILSEYNVDTKMKEIIHSDYQSLIKNSEKFKEKCNTGYVRSVGVGAKYIGNLKLTFNNSQLMNKFKASVSASAGSFASLSASIEAFQKSTNSSINVSIKAQTFGPGGAGVEDIGTCINVEQFPSCVNALNRSKNDFMQTVQTKVDEIQAKLTVNSSRDEALMALSALSQNIDNEVVAYPPAVLAIPSDTNRHDSDAQKALRESAVSYYTSLGKLQSKLNVLRTYNILNKEDVVQLNSISSYLTDKLDTLKTSCFGWNTSKCRTDLQSMKSTVADLQKLDSKYDTFIEKTYYSTDKDVYFIRHTDLDNTIHLYPMILNNAYETLLLNSLTFRAPGSFYTVKNKYYLNPAEVMEIRIKNGLLSYSQFSSLDVTENEAKCNVTESQIRCTPLHDNGYTLPPQIYKALNVTTDDIDKAKKKSFSESDFNYLSDSLEHSHYMNPTLSTTKPWCTDKTSPDDAPNCLQLTPGSLQFNGGSVNTPTEYGYINDSITIKHLTPTDTDVAGIDADVFYLVQKNNSGELKFTSLATIFSPAGTNLYYRLDPNKPFNFIGYPERSLAYIANQVKTEAQFASLLDQAKRDNQISFTRVDFAGSRIRMKGQAVFCHLKTSGVCYGDMDAATLKSKATLYSTSAKRGTDGTTTTDHHLKIEIKDSNDGTFKNTHDDMLLKEYKILINNSKLQFFDTLSVARSNEKNKGTQTETHHHVDNGSTKYAEFRSVIQFEDTKLRVIINCPVTLSVKHRYVNSFADDSKGDAIRYCDNPEWVVLPWGGGYYDYVAVSKLSNHSDYKNHKVADDVGVLSQNGVFLED